MQPEHSSADSPSQQAEVEALVSQAAEGSKAALDKLFTLFYDELRAAARRVEKGDFKTTALVHESYLRFYRKGLKVRDQATQSLFFGAFHRAMRQILIEDWRRRTADKRGGKNLQVASLDESVSIPAGALTFRDYNVRLDHLNRVLDQLDAEKPELSSFVYLKWFQPTTDAEISRILGVSEATVRRRIQTARAWVIARMKRLES